MPPVIMPRHEAAVRTLSQRVVIIRGRLHHRNGIVTPAWHRMLATALLLQTANMVRRQ